MSSDGDPRLDDIRALMRQGQKIAAIGMYRQRFGASLIDAKSAVEGLDVSGASAADVRPPSAPPPSAADARAVDEIRALMRQGQKINAIKVYRERFGVDLKTAKEAVEAIEEADPSGAVAVPQRLARPDAIAAIRQRAQAGQMIDAIRLHREQFESSLLDAKNAVEAIQRGETVSERTGLATASSVVASPPVAAPRPTSTPIEVPEEVTAPSRSMGCALIGFALLALLVFVAAVAVGMLVPF